MKSVNKTLKEEIEYAKSISFDGTNVISYCHSTNINRR